MGSYLSTEANGNEDKPQTPEEILNQQVIEVENYFKNERGDDKKSEKNENTSKQILVKSILTSVSNAQTVNCKNLENLPIEKQYLEFHNTHKNKMPDSKVVVFMQVDHFYEIYSVDGKGDDVEEIANITGTAIVTKGKYRCCGFLMTSRDHYMVPLLENGYTVIVVHQLSNAQPIRRKVYSIHGPGSVGLHQKIDNVKKAQNDAVKINTCQTGHLKNLFIKYDRTLTYCDVFGEDTVKDLMKKISHSINVPMSGFYMLYHGKMMTNERKTLCDYGVKSDMTIEIRTRNASPSK